MNASGLQPHWNELLVIFSAASSSSASATTFSHFIFLSLFETRSVWPLADTEFAICPRLTSNSRSLSFYPNSRVPGACCHNQKLRLTCLIGKTGACGHVLIAGEDWRINICYFSAFSSWGPIL